MENKIYHIVFSGLGGTTNYVYNWLLANATENKLPVEVIFYGVEDLYPPTRQRFETLCPVHFIRKSRKIDLKGPKEIASLLTPNATLILHIDSLIWPLKKYIKPTQNIIFVEHQANHLKDRKRWLWSKMAQKKADKIVTLTREYQSELKEHLKQAFIPEKNVVIRTGIDIQRYRLERHKNEILKIGAVGRLNNQRDFSALIKGFVALNPVNVVLEIAGDGEAMPELKELANSNVKFLGEIDENEMIQFLNSIDIYCKPSFGETSSPAIMEAQAAGLPLVTNAVKGITNILSEENAVLIPPGNVEAWAQGLKKLIENEELRKELGEQSLKFAQEHLRHITMYRNYLEILPQ